MRTFSYPLSALLLLTATTLACSTAIVIQDSESGTTDNMSDSASDGTTTGASQGSATEGASGSATSDPEDTTGGTFGETSTASDTSTSGDPSTSGESTDTEGTSDTEGTGDTDTGDTDTGDTDTDTGDTDTDTDGETACAELGEEECEDHEACMSLFAGEVNLKELCTLPPTFQGCAAAAICDDVLTYACADSDPEAPLEFFSSCLPEGFSECPAPQLKGEC